jgi:hypothetical protein
MKTVRFFTFLVVAILVFSAWTPAPAYAKSETTTVSMGADTVASNVVSSAAKQAKVTITNNTGGIIYITLTGTRSYYFVASKEGKNVFMIDKGRYSVTLRTSACSGVITKKKFEGGNLGSFICRHH